MIENRQMRLLDFARKQMNEAVGLEVHQSCEPGRTVPLARLDNTYWGSTRQSNTGPCRREQTWPRNHHHGPGSIYPVPRNASIPLQSGSEHLYAAAQGADDLWHASAEQSYVCKSSLMYQRHAALPVTPLRPSYFLNSVPTNIAMTGSFLPSSITSSAANFKAI